MPLTGAERARRFREKIKEDPERYEKYKQKQREMVGKRRKKIADFDDNEKEKQREQWRKQKRNQKEKKKESINQETIPTGNINKQNSKLNLINKKLQRAYSKYYRVEKNLQNLNTVIARLRKQLTRTKQKTKVLEAAKIKTEKQFEILKDAVRETYVDCKTLKGKRLLKKVAFKFSQKSGLTLPNILGLKTKIRFFNRRKNNNWTLKVQESIVAFYLRDDVSRCAAGRKECKTKNKQKMQIRYLLDTLSNTHRMYVEEGGKMSFSTFYRCKPYYVISPTRSARDTCMCIKHSNFEYLFTALKLRSIISYKNIDEAVKSFSCDITSFICMHGLCEACKTPRLDFNDNQADDSIKWYQWVRIDHKYQKAGKECVTKKTTKQEQVGTVAELISLFLKNILLFKMHYYNWKEQHRQYRKCVQNLKNNEIAILCDFSENYECKYAHEVQSIHFGASKNSITLHTGAVFFNDKCQTFASVSDNNCHEPEAIWAHLLPVIKYAKERYPEISVIHFFSDGPTSQYRQKKNFFLLNLFTCKLKLEYSTWSFSESGHGKSVADGVGGTVKRQLDRRVSYGCDITNATEAYNVLLDAMKTVKCFYVNNSDSKNLSKIIPSNITAVPGTMKLHQIISTFENTIKYRLLSCFCGDKPGLCNCFSPRLHNLIPNESSSKTTSKKGDALSNDLIIRANKLSVKETYLNEPSTSSGADIKDQPTVITVPSVSDCELLSPSLLIDLVTEQIDLTDLSFDVDTNFDVEGSSCDPTVVPIPSPKCLKKRVRVLYPGDPPPPPKKVSGMSLLYNSGFSLKKVNITCKLCQKDLKSKVKCMVCKYDICMKCSGTDFFDSPCLGETRVLS